MGPFKHGSNPQSILGFFTNDFFPSFCAFQRRRTTYDSDFGTSSSSSETSSIVSFSPPTPSSPLPLIEELDSFFYKEMDSFSTSFDNSLAQYGSIYDESGMFNSPQAPISDLSETSVDHCGNQVYPQNEPRQHVDIHYGASGDHGRALTAHPTKAALEAFQTASTSTERTNITPMDPLYFSVFASNDDQQPELADVSRIESPSNSLDLFIPNNEMDTSLIPEVEHFRPHQHETHVTHPQVQHNSGSFNNHSPPGNNSIPISQDILHSGPSTYPLGRQLRSSSRKRRIRPFLEEDSDENNGNKSDNDPDWHPGVSSFCASKRAASSIRRVLKGDSSTRDAAPISTSPRSDEECGRERKRTAVAVKGETKTKIEASGSNTVNKSQKQRTCTQSTRHSSAPSTSTFACDKCERLFSRAADRERHREFFHNLRRLPCPTCAGEFSRQDALRRHLRLGCKGKGRKRRTRKWELDIQLGIEGARDPTAADDLDEEHDGEE